MPNSYPRNMDRRSLSEVRSEGFFILAAMDI